MCGLSLKCAEGWGAAPRTNEPLPMMCSGFVRCYILSSVRGVSAGTRCFFFTGKPEMRAHQHAFSICHVQHKAKQSKNNAKQMKTMKAQ
jgi:hypothetical protein